MKLLNLCATLVSTTVRIICPLCFVFVSLVFVGLAHFVCMSL